MDQLHCENLELVKENKAAKEQLQFGIALGREMYKEGNFYKNEYFKLCQYVQQCWQYSSTNKEGTHGYLALPNYTVGVTDAGRCPWDLWHPQ